MERKRKCRHVPLSKQPLVLVLGQVRFSSIRQMRSYIPVIQEEFRRNGFPIDRSGTIQQATFVPGGKVPVQVVEQQRWEFRSKDESWSILVMEDSVVLQTTNYEGFENFAKKLDLVVSTVFSKTEHDRLGVVQRVGLRYVDVVLPREGEDYRFYLRSGLHGVDDSVFQERTHHLRVEHVGRTHLGEDRGNMIIRIAQNDQGFDLPPDLVGSAPSHESTATKGKMATLIDMDHFLSGTFEPKTEWILARAYELHDDLIETFHKHVVTEEAIKVWK